MKQFYPTPRPLGLGDEGNMESRVLEDREDMGRKEDRQREGTAVHVTDKGARVPTCACIHTHTHTHTPSSYSELPLTHCSTDSLSQQNHMSQGSSPGQTAPPFRVSHSSSIKGDRNSTLLKAITSNK